MNTYFIIARSIFDSAIWREDPHVLKLFLYLIGQARHSEKTKKFTHFSVARGELITSLSDISENNEFMDRKRPKRWSRQKVSRMLSFLEEEGYIELLPDTYGTHIKIINYDTYQNPGMYKPDSCGQEADSCGQEVYIYNNGNNGNNGNKEKTLDQKKFDRVTGSKKMTTAYSNKFLIFWERYPRKQGKVNSYKSWKKYKCDSHLDEILTGLERWKKSDDWNRDDGRYIPHGSTWVNQRRWEDEVTAGECNQETCQTCMKFGAHGSPDKCFKKATKKRCNDYERKNSTTKH